MLRRRDACHYRVGALRSDLWLELNRGQLLRHNAYTPLGSVDNELVRAIGARRLSDVHVRDGQTLPTAFTLTSHHDERAVMQAKLNYLHLRSDCYLRNERLGSPQDQNTQLNPRVTRDGSILFVPSVLPAEV